MIDVDGILTDGGFYYSKSGKILKKFGPDDSDALKELEKTLQIIFVSADQRGFKISRRRIKKDLGFPLFLIPSENRVKWAKEKFVNHEIIYMGDSFTDVGNLIESDFGISTHSSNVLAKYSSDFVTLSKSGNRAVMEACIFLNQRMNLNANLPSWSSYTKAMQSKNNLGSNE